MSILLTDINFKKSIDTIEYNTKIKNKNIKYKKYI